MQAQKLTKNEPHQIAIVKAINSWGRPTQVTTKSHSIIQIDSHTKSMPAVTIGDQVIITCIDDQWIATDAITSSQAPTQQTFQVDEAGNLHLQHGKASIILKTDGISLKINQQQIHLSHNGTLQVGAKNLKLLSEQATHIHTDGVLHVQ